MIRWLLIALFIYLVYKLITGPKRKKKTGFQFNIHRENGSFDAGQNKEKDVDHIEEAEFEDITDKENKNSGQS